MGQVRRVIEVGASPKDVYEFVAEPRNAPRYISAILQVEGGLEGHESQAWRARANWLGAERSIVLTRAVARPHSNVTFKVGGEQPIDIMFDIQPSGRDNSSVGLTIEAQGLPDLVMAAVLGNMVSADLNRLRTLLERREGAAS